MKGKPLHLLFILLYLLVSCSVPAKDFVLQPAARDILSPDELPDGLRHEQIYWQGRMIYLDGQPAMAQAPVKQLREELHLASEPFVVFSHHRRYMLYRWVFGEKIGLWDLETGERKWLAEAGIDLPAGAKIGGMAFMPNDDKVLFSYTWGDEGQPIASDLALVDIDTGQVERLHIAGFLSDFFEINVSPNGKWAVTGMETLNNRVCFLVNLETRKVECLDGEKGSYFSAMFLPDSEQIVYAHSKDIESPTTIMISRIDGTENLVLVSGLVNAGIELVSANEIVFVSGIYGRPTCGFVYIINQDGSDLRRLTYLGEDCVSDEETPVP